MIINSLRVAWSEYRNARHDIAKLPGPVETLLREAFFAGAAVSMGACIEAKSMKGTHDASKYLESIREEIRSELPEMNLGFSI